MPTDAQTTVAEPDMISASTEICPEANRILEMHRKREDRSRAYVLRAIIHEWALKQPGADKKEIA